MLSSPIEEIKSRLDIVEIIGSYLKLQKTGANYRALCPFHSEKKPSFFVSPSRQLWRCFGCSLGGDVFKFVMQMEGVEFGDALRILAQKAGVELQRQDPELKTQRRRLYEICELATLFFEKQLAASKAGQAARDYLLGRGISEENLKKWRLGYAPNRWQGLSDFLVSRGYNREEIESAGLAIKSAKGKNYYDRFRGRIIFPVFDFNSQVIGFGGRVFEAGQKHEKAEPLPAGVEVSKEEAEQNVAKYINTAATVLYDKSRILYGLDKAKVAIRKQNACLLVEGYTDVILLSQVGSENVVATSGTALTPFQLKILKRYSENLVIAYDMDTAGNSATRRGIDLAQRDGFNIKIVVMPEESDPADIASKNKEEWQKLVAEAKSIMEFYFETTFAKIDSSVIEGKKKIAGILLPVIRAIPNKIEQSYWLEELAKRIKARVEDLEQEMKKVKLEAVEDLIEPSLPSTPKSRKEMLEERLLSLMMLSPESAGLVGDEEISYFSSSCGQIFNCLKEVKGLTAGTFPKFPVELDDLANSLALTAETEDFSAVDIKAEFQSCLKQFKIMAVKNKLDTCAKELKTAEGERNAEKIEALLKQFNLYSQTLHGLQQS